MKAMNTNVSWWQPQNNPGTIYYLIKLEYIHRKLHCVNEMMKILHSCLSTLIPTSNSYSEFVFWSESEQRRSWDAFEKWEQLLRTVQINSSQRPNELHHKAHTLLCMCVSACVCVCMCLYVWEKSPFSDIHTRKKTSCLPNPIYTVSTLLTVHVLTHLTQVLLVILMSCSGIAHAGRPKQNPVIINVISFTCCFSCYDKSKYHLGGWSD